MEVTLLGMIVFLQPEIKVFDDVSIIALQLLRESYLVFPLATVTEVKPEQLAKAISPMEVTLVGIMMEVKLEQYRKA